jgi:SOS-response transcriptional repressor LexA
MTTRPPIAIPVVAAATPKESGGSACSGKELVALMVLGDSMEPEFVEGEILVIELGRPASAGDYVIAEIAPEDFTFRQLQRSATGWKLTALNPAHPDTPLPGLDKIKGVVTHKRNARSRKTVKFYVAQEAG